MSRIEELAEPYPEVFDELNRLLRVNVPQKRILAQLNPLLEEFGEPPLSKAGLSRYASKMEVVGKDMREIEALAEAWNDDYGDDKPRADPAVLASNILKTMAARWAIDQARGGVVDVEEMGAMALALRRIVASATTARELESRMKSAWKKKTDRAVKVARSAGMSSDTVAQLRAALAETE